MATVGAGMSMSLDGYVPPAHRRLRVILLRFVFEPALSLGANRTVTLAVARPSSRSLRARAPLGLTRSLT